MPTFRFRYAAGPPPAPAVLVNLAHPTDPTVDAMVEDIDRRREMNPIALHPVGDD